MRRGVPLLISALLGACALLPDQKAIQDHPGDPAALSRFEIKGRLGLKGRGSATLNWSQARDYYRIVLLGPFGSGRVEIEGNSEGAVWRDKNGNFASSDSPEQFLHQQLGWSLPIESLPYWVRGLASPQAPIEQFNIESGRLMALRQSGWLLRLDRYQEVDGIALPGRLILEQGEQRLTLLIGSWILR